jgi:hypothetical protein
MKPVANRRFAQIVGRKPQTSSLIRPLLIDQSLDVKLQPRNRPLAAVSPVLKGLRLLKEFWVLAEFDHLRTKHEQSE